VLEPNADEFDCSFFVDMIDRLSAAGIATVFCTPTATPPIWISHEYPERMVIDDRGTMHHGARQHVCLNNPQFRERAWIIAEQLASVLGHKDGVIAWQIDNEIKAHVADCVCESCKIAWHRWLADRYVSIEALNSAWCSDIWSQRYRNFDEVVQPLVAPTMHHPSLIAAYRQFTHDTAAEFVDEQANVIRQYSDLPITTNSARHHHVDNHRLFSNLDFASFDMYVPNSEIGRLMVEYDYWRNVKPGNPFWVMETSPGTNGCSHGGFHKIHPEGFIAAEGIAAYALGATSFAFWHWRQHRAGCEAPHGSILSAWGKPAVGYAGVERLARDRAKLEHILDGSAPQAAELAIVYSDDARTRQYAEPLSDPPYAELIQAWYRAAIAVGVHRDLIDLQADLAGYKVLLTSYLPYVPEEFLERALAWVASGGVWIAGPRTGDRTVDQALHTDCALGRLEQAAHVETVFAYPLDGSDTLGEFEGYVAPLTGWANLFEPGAAQSIGAVVQGRTPGLSFATETKIGDGKLVLLGARPDGEAGKQMIARIIAHYSTEAGVGLTVDVTAGTIVAPRVRPDGSTFWVVVNMNGVGGTVDLPTGGTDLQSGAKIPAGLLSIGEYEWHAIGF
jgi:beta-galactosidase